MKNELDRSLMIKEIPITGIIFYPVFGSNKRDSFPFKKGKRDTITIVPKSDVSYTSISSIIGWINNVIPFKQGESIPFQIYVHSFPEKQKNNDFHYLLKALERSRVVIFLCNESSRREVSIEYLLGNRFINPIIMSKERGRRKILWVAKNIMPEDFFETPSFYECGAFTFVTTRSSGLIAGRIKSMYNFN